jgi:hypothetical protein
MKKEEIVSLFNAALFSYDKKVDPLLLDRIYHFLISFRYIREELFSEPTYFIENLFSEPPSNILGYFPCDIVELRYILKLNAPFQLEPFCYFSKDYAIKHSQDNNIIIGFSGTFNKIGNVLVGNGEQKIEQILVRNDITYDFAHEVNYIVKSEKSEVPVFPLFKDAKNSTRLASVTKIADPSSYRGPEAGWEGSGGQMGEGGSWLNNAESQARSINRAIKSPFEKGMKVKRFQNNGIIGKTFEGKVEYSDPNTVVINWSYGKRTYNLASPKVQLFLSQIMSAK